MGRRSIMMAALMALALVPTASAQSWPERPIKLILSQPAGSGPDAVARILGNHIAAGLGQQIVIDNRPGGQNIIGATAAAHAPPDGYTFYFGTLAALTSNVYLFKTLTYDPRKDFAPVGMVGTVPFALVVPAASPIASLDDFFARAKAAPGKLVLANEGPKTFGGMLARLLDRRAGIETNLVAFSSAATAVNDTVANQTDSLLSDVPSTAALIAAGKLRPLAVTSATRVPTLPQVPALAERLPGFAYVGWLAIVAPTGTDAAIVARFNHALDAALRDPEIAARLRAIGPVTEGAGTPAALASFLAAEDKRWATLTTEIGVLPE
ncbi:MAG TPA: tripartite tricarboxylate transporter substrate binding protein [Candidatus Sulfotelmatobacter sp.]|nr:tripartite tricarboxylate transporter substrate binding protein [Candidatus Sulfotelmatobacter sp.]